jgi:gamma-glutamyltranspeptidase/glutathione hydrolase
MRDFHLPGRSPSLGTGYAIATSHQEASLIGAEILRNGGNAIDAAVAACALLGVIEPQSTGIGGDCFAFVWSASDRELHAINGSGHSPMGISADWLRAKGLSAIDEDSVHSVTIPGALRTWELLLSTFGTKSLGELLQPAIERAAHGFPVAQRVAADWQEAAVRLQSSAGLFLQAGEAPRTGKIFSMPQLAQTLRIVAGEGAESFYEGDLAKSMVASLNAAGGCHRLDDFADWRPSRVEPLTVRYRDVDVHQIPPNGQGLVASLMLRILEGFEHKRLDPAGPERFHLQIEAYRLAAEVRDRYIADPDHAAVPVDMILSDGYVEELRDRIRLDSAMHAVAPLPQGPTDTVYLTTADQHGNFCSLINSISGSFGAAICCPQTGVLFQNRGANFTLEDGHPNQVAPRKRSLNTIIPGFATKNGAPYLSFGVMHGFYQPVGQVQVLQNVVDFGMDVQASIDMGRGLFTGEAFEAERSVPAATLQDLARRGHRTKPVDMPWGGGQAIAPVDGVLHAGSDGRKDGSAIAI